MAKDMLRNSARKPPAACAAKHATWARCAAPLIPLRTHLTRHRSQTRPELPARGQAGSARPNMDRLTTLWPAQSSAPMHTHVTQSTCVGSSRPRGLHCMRVHHATVQCRVSTTKAGTGCAPWQSRQAAPVAFAAVHRRHGLLTHHAAQPGHSSRTTNFPEHGQLRVPWRRACHTCKVGSTAFQSLAPANVYARAGLICIHTLVYLGTRAAEKLPENFNMQIYTNLRLAYNAWINCLWAGWAPCKAGECAGLTSCLEA